MTVFSQSHAQSASDLRAAKDLIDRAMEWTSTPHGEGFWQDVIDALESLAEEADRSQGILGNPQGQGVPVSISPPAPTSPPPLNTIAPGSKRPAIAPTLPSLDQLVKKTKFNGAARPVNVTVEEIVHVVDGGVALCGTVQGAPHSWPAGHFRVGLSEYQKATCAECANRARAMPRGV